MKYLQDGTLPESRVIAASNRQPPSGSRLTLLRLNFFQKSHDIFKFRFVLKNFSILQNGRNVSSYINVFFNFLFLFMNNTSNSAFATSNLGGNLPMYVNILVGMLLYAEILSTVDSPKRSLAQLAESIGRRVPPTYYEPVR